MTFEVEGDEALIDRGRFRTSLRLQPADEFPRLGASRRARGDASTSAPFAEALRQVVPAASKDDARPILTGVLLTATPNGLRLVATDSYRLAVRDLAGVEHAGRGPEGARRARRA